LTIDFEGKNCFLQIQLTIINYQWSLQSARFIPNGKWWRKNCGSPHEVRAQKRHTYFVAKKLRKPARSKGAKTAHLLRACFCNFCKKRHTYFVRVSAIFANQKTAHLLRACFCNFCKKRHTYFVRVSAIFANQFCLGIVSA
jgi:hypothetical protein